MSEYRRVLIPIDLMPGIRRLAPAVRRIIDTGNAEITLMHVVEARAQRGRVGHTLRLMTEMELFAHRQFRGSRIARRVEWGSPVDCILKVIRSDSPDAVLLTAGPSSPGDGALGPVAAGVLAGVSCPVLLEWAMTAPVNSARTQPVCAALALDGTDENVLAEAVWTAARIEAPLKLLHALVPRDSQVALLWDPEVRERETALVRLRMEELRDRRAPGAEVHVDVGTKASVISRAIRFHGAGLLVTGGFRESLLAAESECPVLYVGGFPRSQGRPLVAAGQTALAAGRTA